MKTYENIASVIHLLKDSFKLRNSGHNLVEILSGSIVCKCSFSILTKDMEENMCDL